MNAKDINTDNMKLRVLMYGKSGTLKTTHMCSFPGLYVFDFDDGMLSQKGRDVNYDTFSDYAPFEIKLQELERNCPYQSIGLDSVTTMQEWRMNHILSLANRKMPTMNEWNILISSTTDLFMRLSKLNTHLIVIGHEQLLQDEITGEINYRTIDDFTSNFIL